MELINPNEIGSKISTLFSEAKKKIICVAPYIQIHEWKKIKANLEKAISRGVEVKFYYRETNPAELIYLRQIGVKYYQVEGLHTKLYFNEEKVIVTSMNLYEYSDLHSIDVAIQYEGVKEYDMLFDYFIKYIVTEVKSENISANDKISNGADKLEALKQQIENKYDIVRIRNAKNYLFMTWNNTFEIMVDLTGFKLKYRKRQPDEDEIEYMEEIINTKVDQNVKSERPTEDYRYLIWRFNYQTASSKELFSYLDKMKEIQIDIQK